MHFVAKCWFSLNQVVFAAVNFTVFLAPGLCNVQFSCSEAGARKKQQDSWGPNPQHADSHQKREGEAELCLSPRISFPASENTFSFPRRFRGRQYVYFPSQGKFTEHLPCDGHFACCLEMQLQQEGGVSDVPEWALCSRRSNTAECRVTEQSLVETGCKMQQGATYMWPHPWEATPSSQWGESRKRQKHVQRHGHDFNCKVCKGCFCFDFLCDFVPFFFQELPNQPCFQWPHAGSEHLLRV